MKEKIPFQGKGDELQYRLDNLSSIVKAYISDENALENPVLEEADKVSITKGMDFLKKHMNLDQQAELLLHKNWLLKQKGGKNENTS